MKFIRLTDPLPCAVKRDGKLCGRPAKFAGAWEALEGSDQQFHGVWMVEPVCKRCTKEGLARHDAEVAAREAAAQGGQP